MQGRESERSMSVPYCLSWRRAFWFCFTIAWYTTPKEPFPMIRSFWKTHCEGWFGSSELAADGSAEHRTNQHLALTRCKQRGSARARRQTPSPPAGSRRCQVASSPIFIAFTPLSMEDEAAIVASFQRSSGKPSRRHSRPVLPHTERQAFGTCSFPGAMADQGRIESVVPDA